jgi:hypothetical protein
MSGAAIAGIVLVSGSMVALIITTIGVIGYYWRQQFDNSWKYKIIKLEDKVFTLEKHEREKSKE